MAMNLHEFLEAEGITPSAWAKKVGISQPIISRLLSGERGVSLATALRIQDATGGKVRVNNLVKSGNGKKAKAQSA